MNYSRISILIILLTVLSLTSQSQTFNSDSFDRVVTKIKDVNLRINTYNKTAEKVLKYDINTSLLISQKALRLAIQEDYLQGKIEAYVNIGTVYIVNDDFENAEKNLLKAYELSKILKDDEISSTTYNTLAYYYERVGKYDQAIKYYKLAIELNIKDDRTDRLAGNYLNMGITYSSKGNLRTAMGYYIRAVKMLENLDESTKLALAYNNIAILKADLKEFQDAVTYYLKAAELNKQNDELSELAANYNNIAVVYKNLGDFNQAIDYYQQAIKINENIGSLSNLAQNYLNMAVLFHKQKRYDEAAEKYNRSLTICFDIELDIGKVYNYLNMAEMFQEQEKYRETEYYLDQAAVLLKDVNIPDLERSLYENYFNLYKEIGNYPKALFYSEVFHALEDSIYSQDSRIAIEELQEKYETEKTEAENEQLKEQNQLKGKTIKNQRLLWITTSFALILFIVLTFNLIKSRKKQRKNMDELVLLNQDNIEKTEQLAELNTHKDRLFSIIAHDLKNPFHLLLGYSDLLSSELKSQNYEDMEYYSGLISKCAVTGNDLLDNLMVWSRSESGRIVISPEEINLHDLISKTIQTLNRNAIDKKISLANNVDKNCVIQADMPTLSTVTRNLLANAIKFTHNGGKITINCKEDDKEAILSIEDNGVGIQPDVLRTLFQIDKEYTTPGTNNEKGSGLGLVLCKEFIEKNGGKLRVESTPGIGSSFSFNLRKV